MVGVWASSSTEIKLYFSDSDKVFQKFRSKNPFIAFPIEEKSYPFSFRLDKSVLLKQLNKPDTRVKNISLFTRNYFFDLVDYQIYESIIVSPGDRLFPSSYL